MNIIVYSLFDAGTVQRYTCRTADRPITREWFLKRFYLYICIIIHRYHNNPVQLNVL